MSGHNGNGAKTVPAKNGGTIRAPWPKGVSGNPRGALSRRAFLAKELLEKAGLEELAYLAHEIRRRHGALSKALIDAATDCEHKGQIMAQKLAWDLAEAARAKEAELGAGGVEVTVYRKVRIMPGAEPDDQGPREVELEESDAAPPDQSDSALCQTPTFSNSLEVGEEEEPDPEGEASDVCALELSHAPDERVRSIAEPSASLDPAGGPPLPPADMVEGGEDSRPGLRASGAPLQSRPTLRMVAPGGLTPPVEADAMDAPEADQAEKMAAQSPHSEDVSGQADTRVGRPRPPK